ncbi:small integral membrane protein 20 isoform X1 [Dromiciops gliroides]|uniref:small integral membrane protein 20 isoform X1 n=1 Tax=Dromiciops gliroides TaxID=33562 RepID=UPI001CC6672D|nr:small integral membrane protein 20 isoform X1 [Dromiciops gliroides]
MMWARIFCLLHHLYLAGGLAIPGCLSEGKMVPTREDVRTGRLFAHPSRSTPPSTDGETEVLEVRVGTSHKSSWYCPSRCAATRIKSVVGSFWKEVKRLLSDLNGKTNFYISSVLQQIEIISVE